MRVRTFVNRIVWLIILAYVGYAGLAAGSSYLEVRGFVDTAVDEAARRPRAALAMGQPAIAMREFAVDAREAILLGARRVDFDLTPQKLVVEPQAKGIRVAFHWSYPVLVVSDETAIAVPLWIDRTYELKR